LVHSGAAWHTPAAQPLGQVVFVSTPAAEQADASVAVSMQYGTKPVELHSGAVVTQAPLWQPLEQVVCVSVPAAEQADASVVALMQ